MLQPASAKPGDLVTARTAPYTPPTFTLRQREKPFHKAIRLYLVPDRIAGQVRGRFDRRLHYVGSLTPDRHARGVLTFGVPPLDTATYAVAAWWPGDARYGRKATFLVWPATTPRIRLRIEMPDAADTCPVTIPRPSEGWYGNGMLSSELGRSGYLRAFRDWDGLLFQKLAWLPREGFTGDLTVRGERLDAPGRLRVLSVNWGHSSTGRGGWASAVKFPDEGCSRITGRVRDISLTYVVQVVGG